MNDITNNKQYKSSANPELLSPINGGIEPISQNWEVQVMKTGKTPFIVIDNWYTPQEEKNIWKELDFYSSQENIERAENTFVATYEDGKPKSKAHRFHIQEYYTPLGRQRSNIFNYMYKVRTPQFHNLVREIKPFCNSFMSTNADSSLISYYEDSEFYDSHWDDYAWTMLIWFVREPRLFKGGDFVFPDTKQKIKLKQNRALFFPSMFEHKVTPVKMHTKPKEIGYGRYTITHFFIAMPPNNLRD
jgi:Rps23 Pro-64 3,4-dihydroxylase Tpa1-like proline 4-hydroxylase